MKKLLLILLCLPIIGWGQQTYVPDNNFEAYLEANGLGNNIPNDSNVFASAIDTVTNLNVNNQLISDLTGIEDFISLEALHCQHNQLTSLDLSNNIALYYLQCSNNPLQNLNVNNSPLLNHLDCYNTPIASLNLNNNPALNILRCYNTFNGGVSQGQLTALNVSNNPALTELNCSYNPITSLDLSNNPVLAELSCAYNSLVCLDLRNGNNTNFFNFSAYMNPDLYCVSVDNAGWSQNFSVMANGIDTWAYFSDDCASFGCIDSVACNYSATALCDDGSCNYNSTSHDTLVSAISINWNGLILNSSGDFSVTLINSVGCDSITNINFTLISTGISDISSNKERTLISITDMLGKEISYRRNIPLFYIYDDGRVEKQIIIE